MLFDFQRFFYFGNRLYGLDSAFFGTYKTNGNLFEPGTNQRSVYLPFDVRFSISILFGHALMAEGRNDNNNGDLGFDGAGLSHKGGPYTLPVYAKLAKVGRKSRRRYISVFSLGVCRQYRHAKVGCVTLPHSRGSATKVIPYRGDWTALKD